MLDVATCSDAGMVRPHNEDSVFVDPAYGVVILADGMGGYNAGEVASGMATALLGSRLREMYAQNPAYAKVEGGKSCAAARMESEIALANQSIFQGGAKPTAVCRYGHYSGYGYLP